jgi:hypothetical protein
MQADSCFTHHHHNLLPDVPTEVEEGVEDTAEETAEETEEEAVEEGYPRQQDQACSLHMGELLTQSF